MHARRSQLLGALAASAFALAGGAHAQRPTLTVGGVNPQFADLPAAVAAAPAGAVIVCRPGTYTGFQTDKPLRILLEGAAVVPVPGAEFAIDVQNLFGTDEFVLRGRSSQISAGSLGAVRVRNATAPVIIESVDVYALAGQVGLEVFNAGIVHVSRSILVGSPGMRVQLANFVSSENIVGGVGGVGAQVLDTLFEGVRTIFAGNAAPALCIRDCDARLSSDGTSSLAVLGAPTGPVSALEVANSFLQWQPGRFALVAANGAPALSAVNTVEVVAEVPCLVAGPAELGGTASARLTVGVPTIGLIAISFLRGLPVVLASTGIYVDLPPAVLAAAGVVDGVGLVHTVALPNDPSLRGELFALQAITLPASGDAQLSGAGLWLLN